MKGTRELAAWGADDADAIFEGRVQKVELKWKLSEAQVGDVVPAIIDDFDHEEPAIVATLDVSRSYRGDQSKHVQVRTGLGGGDCGFDFETGREYLVYAFKDETGELSTGICSATAPLEQSRTNLAYLRGENPDEVRNGPPTHNRKLCGRVVFRDPPISIDSRLWLLPVGCASPMQGNEAKLESDGRFCVSDVRPGKYHLLFVNLIDDSVTTLAYFPGVTTLTEAAEIDVSKNRNPKRLSFKIPTQKTVSLSGRVSVSGNLPLPSNVQVMLFDVNQPLLTLNYGKGVETDGSFTFQHVLPGEYWAIVGVDSGDSKWWTRKTRVEVNESVGSLALELTKR
jgi:hypothetical protein